MASIVALKIAGASMGAYGGARGMVELGLRSKRWSDFVIKHTSLSGCVSPVDFLNKIIAKQILVGGTAGAVVGWNVIDQISKRVMRGKP